MWTRGCWPNFAGRGYRCYQQPSASPLNNFSDAPGIIIPVVTFLTPPTHPHGRTHGPNVAGRGYRCYQQVGDGVFGFAGLRMRFCVQIARKRVRGCFCKKGKTNQKILGEAQLIVAQGPLSSITVSRIIQVVDLRSNDYNFSTRRLFFDLFLWNAYNLWTVLVTYRKIIAVRPLWYQCESWLRGVQS